MDDHRGPGAGGLGAFRLNEAMGPRRLPPPNARFREGQLKRATDRKVTALPEKRLATAAWSSCWKPAV